MNRYFPNIIALSAAAPGTTNGPDMVNEEGEGIHLVIDITALGGSATLTVTIQGKDPASGKYYTILASTALATTGTTVLRVCHGLTAAANLTANDIIPMNWRVIAVGAVSTVTATISAHVIG